MGTVVDYIYKGFFESLIFLWISPIESTVENVKKDNWCFTVLTEHSRTSEKVLLIKCQPSKRKELARALEKADRENGFLYHQKIPDELPDLGDLKPTHGLAKPDPYTIVDKR